MLNSPGREECKLFPVIVVIVKEPRVVFFFLLFGCFDTAEEKSQR